MIERIAESTYQEILHTEIRQIRVYKTPQEASQEAAEEVVKLVQSKPEAAITYATGDTMIPLYEELAKNVKEGKVNFMQTKGFHLDEYYPCGPDLKIYPYSFVGYLRRRVFGPLGIKNAYEMNGLADDGESEARRYEQLLKTQPINLAIVGTGPWSEETKTGCHIAFNESGTPFDSRTHLAQLNKVTVERDRIERCQDTPDKALTQGIANILEAEQIVLLAFGEGKGRSLHQALYGKIGFQRPASALRLEGHKVTLFIDGAAASQLQKS